VDATEDFAISVDGDVVMFLEAVDEVVGVGLAYYFNTEIIDDKIESGWACNVAEKSRSVASGDITIVCEVFDELDVR